MPSFDTTACLLARKQNEISARAMWQIRDCFAHHGKITASSHAPLMSLLANLQHHLGKFGHQRSENSRRAADPGCACQYSRHAAALYQLLRPLRDWPGYNLTYWCFVQKDPGQTWWSAL